MKKNVFSRMVSVMAPAACVVLALPMRAFAADELLTEEQVFGSGATSGAKTGDIIGQMGQVQTKANLGATDLPVMIGQLISGILGLLGVVMVVLFIYAGFLWMTATGEPEKTKKARGIMTAAVIGSVIILASYAIASFVMKAIIGGTGYTVPTQ